MSTSGARSPRDVYEDFAGRRKAILRALTTDVGKFWEACDPSKENLCLFGYSDGTWAVDSPAEECPPEAPEPALGINFARDGMERRDWISLVAVHSDAWLTAMAFYKSARLDRDGREELFSLMNRLPTCYEVVSGRVKPTQQGGPTTNVGGLKRPGGPSRTAPARAARSDEDAEEGAGGSADWEDGEGDPCPMCGRLYRTEEFWIACDTCDAWFCGRCAKMTEKKASQTKHWRCGPCTSG
ncbi:PHD finger protein ALFIN-LIKE 4 [Tetrabaena socialis]|uniref:PHD finger protein ALFIN-LIKE 4 n=1 Tax=Tetrabaena socialis TaxID=47790 RepID=A0A2J7ZR15_9CHLO|nr:PHD finger protein ALFIN-LIKE 4 [Tetrabaena socialis]|eukprot:PNH02690.1 PHD finger protein ALFIN-LIKE 4 [Tetrabaena socialis]